MSLEELTIGQVYGYLNDHLIMLAQERAELTRAVEEKQAYLKANTILSEIDKRIQRFTESTTALDNDIRNAALHIYHQTDDKNICPEVKIKLFTEKDYDDYAVFKWALENREQVLELLGIELLKPDLVGFRKYLKKSEKPLAFVTETVVPKAQIQRDLSGLISTEEMSEEIPF